MLRKILGCSKKDEKEKICKCKRVSEFGHTNLRFEYRNKLICETIKNNKV